MILGEIFKSFDSLLNNLSLPNGYYAMFSVVVKTWVTLKIAHTGYLTVFGKVQQPFMDTLYMLLKYGIILTIASNYKGYLDTALASIDGIKKAISGDVDISEKLDEVIKVGGSYARMLYEKSSIMNPSGLIASVIVWVATFVAAGAPFLILTISMFTLKIMISTAPFFICCLMFGWLKNFFQQWLSLIFSNLLTFMFISISLNISIEFFKQQMNLFIDGIKNGVEINMFGAAGYCVIIAVLSYLFTQMASEVAKAIAQVSIESAGASAAINGIATALNAGRAAKGLAGNVGVKGFEAGKAAAPYVGKAANAFKQAATRMRGKSQ